MFSIYNIILFFIAYMGLLFFIAYIIEKKRVKLFSSSYVYALSLAIYCTAWTYYGSVGKAVNSGYLFLAVYLGPTLVVFLWPIILKKMIRIKNLYKITSMADLISARYDKSRSIGAIVSIGVFVGIVPYISIQLKAVIQSIEIITTTSSDFNKVNEQFLIDNVGVIVAILMVFFTIIFGLRRVDPSERHEGMIVIVALESIVKLLAILIVGFFISYYLFDGVDDILIKADESELFVAISQINGGAGFSNWISVLLLSMAAIMFLPRQFHVEVVESSSEKSMKTAMWLFPFYLLAITFFTIPIAMGGELLNINHLLSDFYVLSIPQELDKPLLTLIAFLGGFSASTSMIMITTMAMSIMISNYLILPLLECCKSLSFMKRRILILRWVIVSFLIFISYIFYLYVSKDNLIVNIGLISFAAILQFTPTILGGILWKRADINGAYLGMLSGFFIWFYTLIVPQFVKSGWLMEDILTEGLLGFWFLKPTELFGLSGLDSIPHAVFWSMLFNISGYILGSIITKRTNEEVKVSNDFVDILERKEEIKFMGKLEPSLRLEDKIVLFEKLLNQYFKTYKSKQILNDILIKLDYKNKEYINILELAKLYGQVERVLSGTLGAAGAHNTLANSGVFSKQESVDLSNIYANLLAKMKITPEEFNQKLNYFEEKERLLEEHSKELGKKIVERDQEIEARKEAEKEILDLNDTLEKKVKDRTQRLEQINSELQNSMNELKEAQNRLIESEKMASLGGLVAGVAHEINTPVGSSLTGITHFLTLSKDVKKAYDNEELSEEEFEAFLNSTNELANSININLEKTSRLVKSFKQVAVDQSSEALRTFFLKEYIEETLLSIKNITKKYKIDINVDCKERLEMCSYPGALSQIITNLVINSLTHAYTKDDENRIDILVKEESENSIILIYKDYGKGIKEENIPKVFEPFFTTNRDNGGSGLGLSIIYNLVTTKLKGDITINTKENEGCEFNITLPLDSDCKE